jgi:hypothetical protein
MVIWFALHLGVTPGFAMQWHSGSLEKSCKPNRKAAKQIESGTSLEDAIDSGKEIDRSGLLSMCGSLKPK